MPSNDYLLQDFRLTRRVTLHWILISIIGLFFFAYVFSSIYGALTGQTLDEVTFIVSDPGDRGTVLRSFGLFIGLTLVIVLPHELVHGAFMKRYGGTPKYGVGVAYCILPYAYAKSENEYTRNETLLILLAPLVVLSVVGMVLLVVFPTPWLVVPLAANAAGSIGDIWMALILFQYPAEVHVRESDGGTGFQIYGESTTHSQRSIVKIGATLVHGSVVGFGVVTVLILLGFVASLALGIETMTFGIPNSEVFLFRFEGERGTGASVEFGFPTIVGTCVVFGLLYTTIASIFD